MNLREMPNFNTSYQLFTNPMEAIAIIIKSCDNVIYIVDIPLNLVYLPLSPCIIVLVFLDATQVNMSYTLVHCWLSRIQPKEM